MKANHISFQYYEQSKNVILSDITFEIPKKRISLLMGGSGSGKSTLAYILAGLLPQNGGILTKGEVSIHNQNICELKPHQRAKYVSMMFQNADLQFCMSTLYEELIFCLENINLSNTEIDARISFAVEHIGISHLLHQKFNTLSGGEKQKCALTCMIALQSEYLILDEPFANIDPSSAKELALLIQQLQQDLKLSILIIDHVITRWLSIVDTVFILKDNHSIISNKITSDNLLEHKTLFIENGLLFPERFIYKSTPPSTSSPIISGKSMDLSIQKKVLLKNADFDIYPGTINVILGASGCGKTTLLKSFYGLRKFSGELVINNLQVHKKNYKKICKSCGIVLQNPGNQFVTQNVLGEIIFSLQTHSTLTSSEKSRYAIGLLKSFGLDVYQRYSPYMLSQGQQRRLAVLSVLCAHQNILLLDEPTYGQDGLSTRAIMTLLQQKVTQEGLTVIMTTHDVELAKEYADHIFIMNNHSLQSYQEDE